MLHQQIHRSLRTRNTRVALSYSVWFTPQTSVFLEPATPQKLNTATMG